MNVEMPGDLPSSSSYPLTLKVDPSGRVSSEMQFVFGACGGALRGKISGQAECNKGIRLEMEGTTTDSRGRGKIRLAG